MGGQAQNCMVLDAVGDASGDTLKGLVCFGFGIAQPIGSECVHDGADYINDCVSGADCFLSSISAGGDNLCHAQCIPDSTDGGTACATGTCTDVWGLFASANPVGLCL